MLLKKLIAIVLLAYLAVVLAGTLLLSHCNLADRDPKAPDFSAIENTAERKAAFFAYLKPIIDDENQKIASKRQALLLMQEKIALGASLSKREKKHLGA
ncbi:Bax protein [Alteromonadaceae bacterium Bs31]|nr:Bax protein [Alteromonadaceae bacterium Bs31]